MCNFARGECGAFRENPGSMIKYDKKGAKFTIMNETNAPTIATGKYIFFGRVDVEMQAAPGQGIVTAVVLQSDTLDEIDWEWLGGDATQVQSNYFSKGETTTYDRGGFHDIVEPLTTFHKYSIEWNKDAVQWIIDGKIVRTLKAAEAKGFPESPMQIKLGTWCAGGSQTEEGTVMWAGGLTDFSKAPFDAYYKSVTIVDYAGGKSPTTKGVKEYVYGGNSGGSDSIKVKYRSSSDEENNAGSKDQPKPIDNAEESDREENDTSKEDKSKPTGTTTENKAVGEEVDHSTPIIHKPNDGVIGLNFTAIPIGTPAPGNTGSDVPQSAASRGTTQGGLIAGIMFLFCLAA
ncbi:putative glycosidase crf1 [Fusarium oxysporum f. sp. raphani]|nr:putative glycosidase crf1 [Fusarium oxysporum f. sp. raphani]